MFVPTLDGEVLGRTHMSFGFLFTATGLPLINHLLGLGLNTFELAGGCLIGSIAGILPDIDHPDSLLTQGIIPGGWRKIRPLWRAVGWLLAIPPRIIGVPVRATTNHRGGTHSLLFLAGWALLAAPIYALFFAAIGVVISLVLTPFIGSSGHGHDLIGEIGHLIHVLVLGTMHELPMIACAVALGYFAHLFSDSLTSAPVPWLWPFVKGRHLFGLVRDRYFFLPSPFRVKTGSSFEKTWIKLFVFTAGWISFFLFILLPPIEHYLSHHPKVQKEITQISTTANNLVKGKTTTGAKR